MTRWLIDIAWNSLMDWSKPALLGNKQRYL